MNDKQHNTSYKIAPLPDGFKDYFGQATLQKAVSLFSDMQKPLLKGNQLGIDLRVLNYWTELSKEFRESGKRKKWSFYEVVWIKIIEQLRCVGFSMAQIMELKNNLTKPIKVKGILTKRERLEKLLNESELKKEIQKELINLINESELSATKEVGFNILHILIMEIILKKLPLSLAVFTDGSFLILDKTKENLYNEADKQKLLFETHIVISVTAIIKKFLSSDVAGFVVPQISLFSPAETKLFEVVHSGEYESILIHFADKKIKSLELKKSVDVKSRIVDLLHTGDFGQILVKKHKGEIVKIENTLKMNL